MIGKTDMNVSHETIVRAVQAYLDQIMREPQKVLSVKIAPNNYDGSRFVIETEAVPNTAAADREEIQT